MFLIVSYYNFKEEKLWNKAKLSLNQNNFYVSNLSQYISLGEKQRVSKINIKFTNIKFSEIIFILYNI